MSTSVQPIPLRFMPPAPARTDTSRLGRLLSELRPALGPRFEIVRPLVRSGMAMLLLLRHRLTGALFVAKVLHPHLATRPEVIRAFRAEAVHVAALSGHPNIVPVFDLGELNGLFFMIMPFVEGEDLDRLLVRTGRLSREQTLTLAAQIGSLLAHAERSGIVHADVSPGNIRLDTFGNYRLLDFGLSRAAGDRLAPAGGTPAYNSPEQLRGEPLDIRSDLYSLGVLLFECLAGHPLYTAPSLDVLARLHLRGAWELPLFLARDLPLAALLRSLLATDRERRMSSAFGLLGALSALGFDVPLFDRVMHPAPEAIPVMGQHRRRLSPSA